jgi:indolepyruvate ferredoxin oxidoreductase beta subunit
MRSQTIIAGVGGQGVLFTTKIFIEMARRKAMPVLGSQTFGMAQRGGSVVTHLKIGQFNSPLIGEGDADLLIGLDCVEAHRTLPYLRAKRGGRAAACVVNAPNAQAFPDHRLAALLVTMQVSVHRCDADAVALSIRSPMMANLVLLGFGASQSDFPFTYAEVVVATEALSSPVQRSANLEALERGRLFEH